MSDAYQQYEQALCRLNALSDTPEAATLCDEMDALWDAMSKEEQDAARRKFWATLNTERN